MTSDALKTLFHPFEAGALEAPGEGRRVLFLGAEPGFRLPGGFAAELSLVQGFRPDFNALSKAGFDVTPQPDGDGYDMALVLAGRHRGENEMRLAAAIGRVKPGGLIVMAGGNTDGIASLRTRLEKNPERLLAAIRREDAPPAVVRTAEGLVQSSERLYSPLKSAVPLDGHLSKHHGMAFWLRRTPEADAFAGRILDFYGDWPPVEGRFRAAPGMFSHDRVDAGSRLLAQHLPAGLKGAAADFCAGWGYLAVALAERAGGIGGIDLYEADHASLQAARDNMTALAPGVTAGFFWHDLTAEPVARRYDTIVMNPPFHAGRAAEPGLGQAMIRAAAKALKPGGRLFLVANRGLPYEAVMAEGLKDVAELARDAGFKVLAGRR